MADDVAARRRRARGRAGRRARARPRRARSPRAAASGCCTRPRGAAPPSCAPCATTTASTCASTSPASTTSTFEPDRGLPDGVDAERFEVVVILMSHAKRERIRLRTQVPEGDPTLPSLFDVHPGTEAMEREVFDLFGIALRGPPRPHPDPDAGGLGRPPPAQGRGHRPHPRPVQGHRRTPDDRARRRTARSGIETSEGAQEMTDRSSAGAEELLRELGATLRLSETEAQDLVGEGPSEDQTMIINMGPQHPSTHGVLRLMLELEGETVLRTKPIVGYLHTGMEKTGEDLTYLQGPTNVTRMDYAAPLFNELVFSLTTEKLLGIDEDIPAAGAVDPDAPHGDQPHHQQPAVPRHQRHGHRRGVDDALRLARPRGGPAGPRADHRPADEPQLHPPRRRGRRPARRLAGRGAQVRRRAAGQPRRVRRAPHRPADLPGAPPGRRRHHGPGGHRPRRHRSDPALHRRSVGPAPRHALPLLRAGRLRRGRRQLRRLLRPLRHPHQRDPRVDQDHPPGPRPAARRATTGSRTRRSRRRRAPASTSRWKR